jgi:hypothetical protein
VWCAGTFRPPFPRRAAISMMTWPSLVTTTNVHSSLSSGLIQAQAFSFFIVSRRGQIDRAFYRLIFADGFVK